MGVPNPQESLRGGLDALEHTSVAVRSMFRSILDLVRRYPEEDGEYARAIRAAFAELLTDLAAAVRAFGTVVRAEVSTTTQAQEASLSAALEKLRLSRAGSANSNWPTPGRTWIAGNSTRRCWPPSTGSCASSTSRTRLVGASAARRSAMPASPCRPRRRSFGGSPVR